MATKEPKDKESKADDSESSKEQNHEEAVESKGKNSSKSDDAEQGVTVSEEFQKKAHELMHKATKHEVKHLHDKAYAREDELRQEEDKKKSPKGKVKEFSSEAMPSSDY